MGVFVFQHKALLWQWNGLYIGVMKNNINENDKRNKYTVEHCKSLLLGNGFTGN